MNTRRRTVLALVALVLATTGSFLLAWFFAEANLLNGLDKVFSVIGGMSGIAAVYLAWKQRGPLTGYGAGQAPHLWPGISLEVPGHADGEQIRGRDTLIAGLIGLLDRHAKNTKRVRVLHGTGGAPTVRSRGHSSGRKRVSSFVLPSTSIWPRTVPVC